MSRKLLQSLCLLWIIPVTELVAANYYVCTDGDDSNAGTSESAAWKSIDRVNTAKLNPGDKVYFHSEDVFRGQLVITGSGEREKPIEITAYGSGTRPILSGAEPAKSWVAYTNGIYMLPQPKTVISVYMNDTEQRRARHPNSGFNRIERGDKVSLVDGKGLPTTLDLTGATARIRACDWQYEVMKVASQTSNQIFFDKNMMYQCSPGYGYFLDDKLAFLDVPGEWFFDSGENALYFMPPSNVSLAEAEVEVTVHDSGILLSAGISNIAVQNLQFEKYATAGVLGRRGSSQVSITNCVIRNIGTFGVCVDIDCGHYRIENNLIEDIGGRGISVLESSNNEIVSNVTRRVGLNPGYGFDGGNNAIGIAVFKTEITFAVSEEIVRKLQDARIPAAMLKAVDELVGLPYPDEKFLLRALGKKTVKADFDRYSAEVARLVREEMEQGDRPKLESRNNRVAYNRVEEVGYDGIRLDGRDSVAEFNVIKNTVMRMSDGGALYCWGQNENYTFNNILRSNIILRAVGNSEGTPNTGYVVGIYLDNKTHHIRVEGNVVMQCGSGIVVNDEAHDNLIIGNTCYDNRFGMEFHEYLKRGALMRCEVYSNSFFGVSNEQRALWLRSSLQEEFQPAAFDANVYGGPAQAVVKTMSELRGTTRTRDLTLQEWRQYYHQDVHSRAVIGHKAIILFNEERIPANYKVPAHSKVLDLGGKAVGETVRLEPFACQILIQK